jgi:hypothetical protein
MNTGTTEVSSGPFYTITASVADSTKIAAGSIVVVRATVKHETTAVANAAVGWLVKAGGGKVNVTTTATDTLGQTSVQWLLSDSTGINTLIMGSGDAADTISVIAVVGTPVYLLAVGIDSVNTTVGTTVTLQARVTDRVGNNVVGTAVNWVTTGGAVTPATIPTVTGGISQVGYSYPTAGTYFVTATLPGQATHTYTIVVR